MLGSEIQSEEAFSLRIAERRLSAGTTEPKSAQQDAWKVAQHLPPETWVDREGIEPPTQGFSVLCSTN